MMAQVDNEDNTEWTHFDPKEAGYDELDKFYTFVTENLKKEVIVMDSDEFAANPGAGVKLMCKGVGIEYKESMMEWDASKRLDTNWEGWNPFFDRVQNAVGFEVVGGKGATDHSKSLPANIEAEVVNALPSYEKLSALRTVIPKSD